MTFSRHPPIVPKLAMNEGSMIATAEARQRQYYERTAKQYDELHVRDGDEHGVALEVASALMTGLKVRSVLDVGAGTGRAGRVLRPNFHVTELEPVAGLLAESSAQSGGRTLGQVRGTGYNMPFPDGCFDAVCETGTLHHVRHPSTVVREMLRVARRAVFISDSNRFAQGPMLAGLTKLALCKMHLWPAFRFMQTKGKWYHWSEGDGVAYSYSVYDSLRLVSDWADQVFFVPVKPVSRVSWHHPLLTTNNVLLCGIRGGWIGSDKGSPCPA